MPPRPYDVCSRRRRIRWSTVSKAADISKSVNIDRLPVSAALRMSESTFSTAVSVEWWARYADCRSGSSLCERRHNFVKNGDNWIKICSLAWIRTYNRCVKKSIKNSQPFVKKWKMSGPLGGEGFFDLHCKFIFDMLCTHVNRDNLNPTDTARSFVNCLCLYVSFVSYLHVLIWRLEKIHARPPWLRYGPDYCNRTWLTMPSTSGADACVPAFELEEDIFSICCDCISYLGYGSWSSFKNLLIYR